MNYNGMMDISIKAYYENGHSNIYYREMRLEDLPRWLAAHNYTHPDVIKYTVKIDT